MGNDQINDLIFKELIKRGYSLEGKTRVWNIADSKLWYLTPDQAQSFLDLENSKDYQKNVIQKEMDLINSSMNDVVDMIGKNPINIIDVGCGDGKKAVLFISKLLENGDVKFRYCPVDISSYMIGKALDRIKKLNAGEVVEFQWNVSDFENLENISSMLRYKTYKNNLVLLLGNTLGNFEINEILYEIRSAMDKGDVLIIGNGLDNRNEEEILKSYNTPELDSMLSRVLTQIGIKRENLEYKTRFANSRVEMYYVIRNDCTIDFLGKKVHLCTGDQIIVAISYKYTKDDFKSFMSLYFNEVDVKISEDKSYALALCKM